MTPLSIRAPKAEDRDAIHWILASSGDLAPGAIETALQLIDAALAPGGIAGCEVSLLEDGGIPVGYACFGPAPLPGLARGEVAGSYMVSLLPGVDADAFARSRTRERKLNIAVSTPRYLTLRGNDADAGSVACLAGVERVVRDVEGKRD